MRRGGRGLTSNRDSVSVAKRNRPSPQPCAASRPTDPAQATNTIAPLTRPPLHPPLAHLTRRYKKTLTNTRVSLAYPLPHASPAHVRFSEQSLHLLRLKTDKGHSLHAVEPATASMPPLRRKGSNPP